MENALNLDTVKLAENKKEIVILDQTLLPNQCKYLNISTAGDIWEAIYSLRVRGAPAIGIFAGYCMALFSKDNDIYALKKYLDSSRPTAVNLSWATARIVKAYESGKNLFDFSKWLWFCRSWFCIF